MEMKVNGNGNDMKIQGWEGYNFEDWGSYFIAPNN